MAEQNNRLRRMTLILAGACFIAGVSYWYLSTLNRNKRESLQRTDSDQPAAATMDNVEAQNIDNQENEAEEKMNDTKTEEMTNKITHKQQDSNPDNPEQTEMKDSVQTQQKVETNMDIHTVEDTKEEKPEHSTDEAAMDNVETQNIDHEENETEEKMDNTKTEEMTNKKIPSTDTVQKQSQNKKITHKQKDSKPDNSEQTEIKDSVETQQKVETNMDIDTVEDIKQKKTEHNIDEAAMDNVGGQIIEENKAKTKLPTKSEDMSNKIQSTNTVQKGTEKQQDSKPDNSEQHEIKDSVETQKKVERNMDIQTVEDIKEDKTEHNVDESAMDNVGGQIIEENKVKTKLLTEAEEMTNKRQSTNTVDKETENKKIIDIKQQDLNPDNSEQIEVTHPVEIQKKVERKMDIKTVDDIKEEKAEIKRLNDLIKKYEDIADRVSKYKHFKYKNGKLKIYLIRATNMEDEDIGFDETDLSDVMVKLEVPNSKYQKSTIVKDTENPQWNEEFIMNIHDPLRDILTLTVQDHDATINDRIGIVKINIIDVLTAHDSCIIGEQYDVVGSKYGWLFCDLWYFE